MHRKIKKADLDCRGMRKLPVVLLTLLAGMPAFDMPARANTSRADQEPRLFEDAPRLGPALRLPKVVFLPAQEPSDVAEPALQTSVRPTRDRSDPQFKKASFLRTLVYANQLFFYTHVMRVAAQDFTREELGGPFFRDWFDSVHVPHKWGDLDSWEINYLGHAIYGSAGVRIWLDQREPQAKTKKQYWASMGRAFLFGVLFSEQYEIGPISEASIGNVGLRSGRTGWSDHVWTPIGGVAWALAEDAIDKYVLAQIDKHVPFVMARAAARMILNPGRMLANIGQNRVPWDRPGRQITSGLTLGR